MNRIIPLMIFIFCTSQLRAQSFAEWFQQSKTQKKYLAQQIVALQAYAGFLKSGYNIAQKGLGTISDIKNGDFQLNSLYFGSLKAVNPEIARYPRISDIITIQQNIARTIARSKTQMRSGGAFLAKELDYFHAVYDRLERDCDQTITELELVTTPGKLELKDDERLERIEALFTESQGQLRFVRQFSNGLAVMALQKKNDRKAIDDLNTLYGIK